MKKTSIGGQALIEGLMMIGPENVAIAIRKADGEIIVDKRDLPKKIIWSKIPIVRGAVNFFRQMVIGMKALMFSASFVEIEEEEETEEESKFDKVLRKILGEKLYGKLEEKFSGNKIPDFMIYISVIISILFSIGLFIIFPHFIATLLGFKKTVEGNVLYHLFEGTLRLVLFFAYLFIVSFMKDIKRVWQYHGAEHKTIHCYEHGDELTVDNVKKYSTKHPRCGTSFMFLVMIIAMLIFATLPRYELLIATIGLRVLFMPLVAGVSYEILKFVGSKTEWTIMKIINSPGMALQFFTTREPDESQIEVAIEAFNNVLVPENVVVQPKEVANF